MKRNTYSNDFLAAERHMRQQGQWYPDDLEGSTQRCILDWCRRMGEPIQSLAGSYVLTHPSYHPLTGGVMGVDWSRANVTETPSLLAKYFDERSQPWLWWSRIDRDPCDLAQRLQAVGLSSLMAVELMSLETIRFKPSGYPQHWRATIVADTRSLALFSQLFLACYGLKKPFAPFASSKIHTGGVNDRTVRVIAFSHGKPVGIATLYRFARYGIVSDLGVLPAYRDSGMATMLLEEIVGMAYLYRLPHLIALATPDAQQLLSRYGFESRVHYAIYGNQEIESRLTFKAL